MTRSTRLLAVGIVVLVAALVALLVATRSQPDPVVVADEAPDTLAAPADATAATDEATGTVGALSEGTTRLPVPLSIPDGHEALAVSATYDAAVAGLPAPGDRVNVYGVFQQGLPSALGAVTDEGGLAKGAVRALAGVEVLGVSGATAETAGGTVTLVLALTPDDAERAIYLAGTEQVWFTLVGEGAEPVPGAGVTREDVLG